MLKYVLFDHDGTLFDTEPVTLPSLFLRFNTLYGENLRASGKGLLDMNIFRDNFHGLAREKLCAALAEYYGFAVDTAAVYEGREAYIAAYYATLEGGVKMAPHLLPALRELKDMGLGFAVVSNNAAERSRAAMRHADDRALGAELLALMGENFWEAGAVQKPDPDVYLRAMAGLGVTAEQCVAIEDSVAGATSAVAAGLVTFGYTGLAPQAVEQAATLKEAGCALVFEDYAMLPGLIQTRM